MSSSRIVASALTLLLLGCGDDDRPSTTDGGHGSDATAACSIVDRTCPEEIPAQAAPCETGLTCDYTVGGEGGDQWRYDCTDGLWVATNVFCSHDGICVPPLHQECDAPFTGTLAGVTVGVGPWAGRFRAFDTAEAVPLVWGPQGGAMIPFRVQLAGDGAPSCVRAMVSSTIDGTAGPEVPLPVAMTCGLSQPILFVVPIDCGGTPEHTVDLTVRIDGIGEATASITTTGGDQPCTR